MARPLRIQFPGALYHAISRGNERQTVFADDIDRARFLEYLWRTCERRKWNVLAYCLMANHYHFLVQTLDSTLSRGMGDINSAYSQFFNRRHSRVGHLFQGRFRAIIIDAEAYLLDVTRYIVLNPVKAGLCAKPEQWRWSSFRAMVGRAPVPRALRFEPIMNHFRGAPEPVAQFEAFVNAGMTESLEQLQSRLPMVLGDEDFVAKIRHQARETSTEVCRAERRWDTLDDVERVNRNRNDAIQAAYNSGLFTLRDIGDHFRLHYTTICRIARRPRATMDANAKRQDLTP